MNITAELGKVIAHQVQSSSPFLRTDCLRFNPWPGTLLHVKGPLCFSIINGEETKDIFQ